MVSSKPFSSLPLLSRASASDGPVSAGGPLGVGSRPASGDREPSSAPIPQKLPPVSVTDGPAEPTGTTQRHKADQPRVYRRMTG